MMLPEHYVVYTGEELCADNFGNVSQKTSPYVPFISHQPLAFTVPVEKNRATALNYILNLSI